MWLKNHENYWTKCNDRFWILYKLAGLIWKVEDFVRKELAQLKALSSHVELETLYTFIANRCSHFTFADYKIILSDPSPNPSLASPTCHLSHAAVTAEWGRASDAKLQLLSCPIPWESEACWWPPPLPDCFCGTNTYTPTRRGPPTSIWQLSSVPFPGEVEGFSVCYFQTSKSCWCLCVRWSISL